MIKFFYETDFELPNRDRISSWITKVVGSENKDVGDVNFIFCGDEYLLKINMEFLNHDTYTDIISFDNTVGNEIGGDIFISIDRVWENAREFEVDRNEEMKRVMAHGVLHLCGYKDKSKEEAEVMRSKEDEKLLMFHVEH